MNNDTIVALSTPPGVGGVAVVRLSGPQAKEVALRFLSVGDMLPRRSHFARFEDGGRVVDEVLAVWYPAPHSYTGQPVVELSCHGSLYVQQAIVEAIVRGGARLARPGEFTQRAFLNGKLNLSQAEAVADLIESVSPVQHRLAMSQLRGGYATELARVRRELVDLASLLELELDFSEEDVEFANRRQLMDATGRLLESIGALLRSFRTGNALKNGVAVAIVGRPNVGKSTLLNVLLDDDRAIVSDIPGTTRDTVEDTAIIGGVMFRFVDTAGIRRSDDPIEQLGIERSRRAMQRADVVLLVTDGNEPDAGLLSQVEECRSDGRKCLTVVNKCDKQELPDYGRHEDTFRISAKEGHGVAALKDALAGCYRLAGDAMLTNVRHYEAMAKASEALRHVAEGLEGGLPADLVAVDLRDALYHLGTITGDVTSDELLGNIFSRFCIGK